MYIAFDFDGVIADTGKTMASILTKKFGTWIREEDLYVHHIEHGFQISKEEANDIVNELCSYKETMKTFPVEDCQKFFYKLYSQTDEKITIVTARTDLDVVKKWLDYYLDGSMFEIFSQDHGTKGGLLKKLGVDLFVEDHLMNAIEVANNGIIPIIYLKPWNKHCFTERSMINRIGYIVNNWNDIDEIFFNCRRKR